MYNALLWVAKDTEGEIVVRLISVTTCDCFEFFDNNFVNISYSNDK